MPTPGTPRPARRLGQNYLADDRLAAALVDLFDPRPDDVVVEIGPGPGALTRHLAPRCGRLVALEIDPRMLPGLAALLAPHPHAEVRLADALAADWDALAAELGARPRVIGNLPYNVGTPIVRRTLASDAVRDVQVVLQLEVAERLLAGPGTKAYGPVSVVAALRRRREKLRLLAPGCFRPRPRVTSCALRLTPLDDPPLSADELPRLERWLFAGFGQRRKTLAGNLGSGEGGTARRAFVQEFLAARGLPQDARAEAVPPETWLALARLLG